ncbi:hypothetical protein STENM327S_09334 [Streptomyces tendae]
MRTACSQTGSRAGERDAMRNPAARTRTAAATGSHHMRPSRSASVPTFTVATSGVRSTS